MDIDSKQEQIIARNKHETELIHQRMTWLGTFQGLLFAAVAFAWDKQSAKPVLYVACIVGVLVSTSIDHAIRRANIAIDKATAEWDRIKPADYDELDVEGFRSGSGVAWLMPGVFVPKVFIATWVVMGLITCIR